MSQYSPMKLVIKITKKKWVQHIRCTHYKIDGENYFKISSMLAHIALGLP